MQPETQDAKKIGDIMRISFVVCCLVLLFQSHSSYAFTISARSCITHRGLSSLSAGRAVVRTAAKTMPLRRTITASMPSTNLAEAVISAAPSGVNLLPLPVQAAIFVSIFIALGLGTVGVTEVAFPALKRSAPGFFESFTKTFWLIGFAFIFAGASHFLVFKDFCNSQLPARGERQGQAKEARGFKDRFKEAKEAKGFKE
jgi:hypothetical protein